MSSTYAVVIIGIGEAGIKDAFLDMAEARRFAADISHYTMCKYAELWECPPQHSQSKVLLYQYRDGVEGQPEFRHTVRTDLVFTESEIDWRYRVYANGIVKQ